MNDGPLYWSIRRSFVRYVLDARGTIEFDGLEVSPDQAERGFAFRPAGTADHDGVPVAKFVGTARFRAHGGMLDLSLSDPWVIEGVERSISVWARSRSMDARLVLASDTGDGFALTEEGVDVFDQIYPEGSPIEAPNRGQGG